MPLIPVGLDQVIQQSIVDELEATAAEQSLIDPNVNFFVVKNRLLPFDKTADSFPLVHVWIDSLDPDLSASTQKSYSQEIATYNLDLYTIGDVTQPELPDENAISRLLYLKDQVKFTILSLINIDFGLPPGCISRRNWPKFQQFKPDMADTESTIPTGRWTFQVEYFFTPEDNILFDLKKINVDTDMWSAFFDYC